MHGGTISSGRLATFAVVASYCRSSISALRKTTLPGVTARLRPSANADSSLIVIRPLPMSPAKLLSPATTLAPSVSNARFSTSGFVAGKFVGAIASTNCRTENSSRRFSAAGRVASDAIAFRYSP